MPTARTLAALAGPSSGVAAALLALPEDQWFDRKSIRTKPDKLAETLVAMANAEGGVVVVGLSDGAVEGVDGFHKAVNSLRQVPMNFTVPPVHALAREVPCYDVDDRPTSLLVFEVDSSPAVHTTPQDGCFLRVGDQNRRLSFLQRQELNYDKGQAQFDGEYVPDAFWLEDLDQHIVDDYANVIGASDGLGALQARGLMSPDRRVTNGAFLLFGRKPQTRFPQAFVRVLRYRGVERQSGRRQALSNDIRCEGPLPAVLKAADTAISELQPQRRFLGPPGRFVVEGLIPRDAWLEGVVNAVIHRSYSVGGDHIRVDIFDDRIEIESPGRFPGLVRLDDVRSITRFARNPRIARVCSELNFGQELGEGIRRIFEEMRLAGLSDPGYRQTAGSTVLTLSATSRVPAHLLSELGGDAQPILDYLRSARRASTGDIASAIGVSRPTAGKRLRLLQDVGLVHWEGKTARDPRATWRLDIE